MDTILALREKRKNLWDAAKNFLDTVRDETAWSLQKMRLATTRWKRMW